VGFPRLLSSFPGFKKNSCRFLGINSDLFVYKFFRYGDPLGALKTPFFCLLTYFIPLADPFFTAFWSIFYHFLTHFLPFSDPFFTACRPSFYFSRQINACGEGSSGK
jgi:hypothetical protein